MRLYLVEQALTEARLVYNPPHVVAYVQQGIIVRQVPSAQLRRNVQQAIIALLESHSLYNVHLVIIVHLVAVHL